jgi:hypothetical protein
MMQAPEMRVGNDAVHRLNGPRARRILVQRQVRASLVIVSLIRFEQMEKMLLAKHNNMVKAVPVPTANPTADGSLRIGNNRLQWTISAG